MSRLALAALALALAGCGDLDGRRIAYDCLDCGPPIDVEPAPSTSLLADCGFSSITPSGEVTVTACEVPTS